MMMTTGGWRVVRVVILMTSVTWTRRDMSNPADTADTADHAALQFHYGDDLGHDIHPNRHRHHTHDIYIAGFFPTSPGHAETSTGQGVMPAVKLALHDVNRSPHILPNHHLRMHWNNTAVSDDSCKYFKQ